jgi:hypothetical protein
MHTVVDSHCSVKAHVQSRASSAHDRTCVCAALCLRSHVQAAQRTRSAHVLARQRAENMREYDSNDRMMLCENCLCMCAKRKSIKIQKSPHSAQRTQRTSHSVQWAVGTPLGHCDLPLTASTLQIDDNSQCSLLLEAHAHCGSLDLRNALEHSERLIRTIE